MKITDPNILDQGFSRPARGRTRDTPIGPGLPGPENSKAMTEGNGGTFAISHIKMRIDLYVIKLSLNLRTNRAGMLLIILMKANGNPVKYSDLIPLITPNARDILSGKKLIRVYINEIRNRIEAIGLKDPIKSHPSKGYSLDHRCAEIIQAHVISALRNSMGDQSSSLNILNDSAMDQIIQE